MCHILDNYFEILIPEIYINPVKESFIIIAFNIYIFFFYVL